MNVHGVEMKEIPEETKKRVGDALAVVIEGINELDGDKIDGALAPLSDQEVLGVAVTMFNLGGEQLMAPLAIYVWGRLTGSETEVIEQIKAAREAAQSVGSPPMAGGSVPEA